MATNSDERPTFEPALEGLGSVSAENSAPPGATQEGTIGRGHWMALGAAILGWLFDGFEMGLFPLKAQAALRELLGSANQGLVDQWYGAVTAGFLVGASTGGVLFGWLGDRIGRVRAMALSILTYSIFSGMCGIAGSATEIFLYRFIAALGMGGEWSLGVSLVVELWPNRSRGWLAGLIGAASNVGFVLVALISLGLAGFSQAAGSALLATGLPSDWVAALVSNEGWRLLMIIGAAPALLTFLVRLFVPESERWLHEQRRGATSFWVTRDLIGVLVGACGPLMIVYLFTDPKPFRIESPEVIQAVRLGGTVAGLLVAIVGYLYPVRRYLHRAAAGRSDGAVDTRMILRRMLIGACLSGVALLGTWGSIQWAANWAGTLVPESEVSYAKAYTQMFSGFGAILGTIVAAVIGSRIGRRPGYALLCLGALGSSFLFFRFNHEFGPMFLATVFLAGGLTASFYGWLPLYLPELFPTRVRATGQGFSFNFGRTLAAIGTLHTGYLMKDVFNSSFPLACSTMSLVYLVGLVIIWFAPETHGKPLPE